MEEERFFTGYCRQLDGSRTVTLVTENGTLTEVDCCYGSCIYESGCTIARTISDTLGEIKKQRRTL